jgi:putative DNA primase/helicase
MTAHRTFIPSRGHLPSELLGRVAWLCWRYESINGKETKVPYQATGQKADSTEPSHWTDFETALNAAADPRKRFNGVGYVFSEDDPYTGIDLDDCIDDTGAVVPAARAVIVRLDSYTEVSPSGRGVKIWVRGKLPPGSRCSTGKVHGFKKIEFFSRERYFTVTGQRLEGTPAFIGERQGVLTTLHAEVFGRPAADAASLPPPPPDRRDAVRAPTPLGFPGTDEELITRARAASNGAKFGALFDRGDTSGYGGDDSAADLALCAILAFWCGPDAVRIERVFGMSNLVRAKWLERPEYRARTIATAVAGRTEWYGAEPRPGTHAAEPLLLSPRDPLPSARRFVERLYLHPLARTLHHYRGEFFEWDGIRYAAMPESHLRSQLYPFLEAARQASRNGPIPFQPTSAKVDNVLDALRAHVHLASALEAPCWTDPAAASYAPTDLVVAKNGLVHLPTTTLTPHTPCFFSSHALPYQFHADAPMPTAWQRFLSQLWPDDPASIQTLQEWFGYSLTADTAQQKILLVVGPPRSGKGTIARVWSAMLGPGSVAAPTLAGLETNFGMWPLIGKLLAVISDARLSGRPDQAKIVERLLSISGEDTQTIDRKHLPPWTGRLGARLVILTNEVPRLTDASGAVASRFIVLTLHTSFLGKEDKGLEQRLIAELPAILWWAIEGRRRLQERGRFEQPESGAEMVRDLRELASPMATFVEECCEVGPGYRESVPSMYSAWRGWCGEQGRDHVGPVQGFGRDLKAAVGGITESRPREGGERVRYYVGIRLRTAAPDWGRRRVVVGGDLPV